METEKIKYLLKEIALNKNAKAYKELFISYYENLHRFAFSILKSKEDTEEVVSDFFITLWQKKESLHGIMTRPHH
jgi:RNA polymerase sigma-70 factor (ECF subfamily)